MNQYSTDSNSGKKLITISIILSVTIIILITVSYSYVRLDSDYASLKEEAWRLSSRLSEIQHSYDLLSTQYDELSKNYSSLVQSYKTIQEDYEVLKAEKDELSSKYDRLRHDYLNLEDSYYSANRAKENLEKWYSSIRSVVNLRQGSGEDVKVFITPDDPLVGRIILQTTDGWSSSGDFNEFWSELKKMYDWIISNIIYNYDSPSPILPETYGNLE
jgi:predicted nuclease with TOPRIM domain